MYLRAANCDFSNGLQEGPTDSGITVDITLNTTGTKHYACQIAGHCTAGNMNQQVIVANCAAAGVWRSALQHGPRMGLSHTIAVLVRRSPRLR